MILRNSQSPPGRGKSSGENIGRWMVYAAWALLMLLLTFLFSHWLDHQHNPNRNLLVTSGVNESAALTLQRNKMGHYVAPGLINGVPVVFLLDTGATHVALPEDLATKIGLKRGVSASSMTANGLVRSWMTELDTVQLGPLLMSGVKAAIMPSMPGSDVLLGMSFLKHLELIQKGDQLILKAPDQH
ncbi:MAG: retropepsin-like aspartic protease [Pseudomonadota bacterium]